MANATMDTGIVSRPALIEIVAVPATFRNGRMS
jgi:hypothetical protein